MAWFIHKKRHRSKLIDNEKELFGRVVWRGHIFCGDIVPSNLCGEDMNVSADLPQLDGDMRPIKTQRHSTARQDRRRERANMNHLHMKLVDKKGLQFTAGMVVLGVAGFACGVAALLSCAEVSNYNKQIIELQQIVERKTEARDNVRHEYEEARNSQIIDVSGLGLMSVKNAKPKELVVPANAVVNPADVVLIVPKDTLATITGD